MEHCDYNESQTHFLKSDATPQICLQGEGRDGQLGHGSNDSDSEVQHVIFLYRVKAVGIACGAAHTLLLDENGR